MCVCQYICQLGKGTGDFNKTIIFIVTHSFKHVVINQQLTHSKPMQTFMSLSLKFDNKTYMLHCRSGAIFLCLLLIERGLMWVCD